MKELLFIFDMRESTISFIFNRAENLSISLRWPRKAVQCRRQSCTLVGTIERSVVVDDDDDEKRSSSEENMSLVGSDEPNFPEYKVPNNESESVGAAVGWCDVCDVCGVFTLEAANVPPRRGRSAVLAARRLPAA